jgi:hypothetical protein
VFSRLSTSVGERYSRKVNRALRAVPLLLVLTVLATRLAHADLLWVEESYGLAAAREILAGKSLYSQIWFDKPPIYAWIYLLWGAKTGLVLRLAGAAHVLFSCWLAYRCARAIWPTMERHSREGVLAAGLLGFYLTFGIPSAVMALAPDLLMVPLHLAAVWMAVSRRPFLAGLFSGLALLTNAKGVFVLATALVFAPWSAMWILAGFALPNLIFGLWIFAQGGWNAYALQVWQWGTIYARDPYLPALSEGLKRTLSWSGFQFTLIAGTIAFFARQGETDSRMRLRIALWIALSLIAVAGGARFFPRYYFHLLVPVVIAGSRGLVLLFNRRRTLAYAAFLLLLIPLGRFGPRYVALAYETITRSPHEWRDLALFHDSREVADWLRSHAKNTDHLLVWGYRPEIFVLSDLRGGTPAYLDSQPLSGVLADRHLSIAKPTPELVPIAQDNRNDLRGRFPEWVVDGLGLLNPDLAITRFPDLASWLSNYREVSRTKACVVYRRID